MSVKCDEQIKSLKYQDLIKLAKSEDITQLQRVIKGLEDLGDYQDSSKVIKECLSRRDLLVECTNRLNEAQKANKYPVTVDELEQAAVQYQWIIDNYGDFNGSKAALNGVKEHIERLNREKKQKTQSGNTKRLFSVISIFVVVLSVMVFIIGNVILPRIHNQNIIKLIDDNNAKGLISIVSSNANETIVKFGEYEWYVIDVGNSECTLLAKDIVEKSPYNMEQTSITWEDSTLRSWLNNDFYNQFSNEEKKLIHKHKCLNSNNLDYGTNGGNDTEDYIYLLNMDEAKSLSNAVRKASDVWWLRTPGDQQDRVAFITSEGLVKSGGHSVDTDYEGVRPAITIKFDE